MMAMPVGHLNPPSKFCLVPPQPFPKDMPPPASSILECTHCTCLGGEFGGGGFPHRIHSNSHRASTPPKFRQPALWKLFTHTPHSQLFETLPWQASGGQFPAPYIWRWEFWYSSSSVFAQGFRGVGVGGFAVPPSQYPLFFPLRFSPHDPTTKSPPTSSCKLMYVMVGGFQLFDPRGCMSSAYLHRGSLPSSLGRQWFGPTCTPLHTTTTTHAYLSQVELQEEFTVIPNHKPKLYTHTLVSHLPRQ